MRKIYSFTCYKCHVFTCVVMDLKPDSNKYKQVAQFSAISSSGIQTIMSSSHSSSHALGENSFPQIQRSAENVFRNSNTNTSKPSLIITNSSFTSEKEVLSGVLFKNEMCLGLPSNVTWEELASEKLFDPLYLRNLFDCTRELNREFKKKRPSKPPKSKPVAKQMVEKYNEKPISPIPSRKAAVFARIMAEVETASKNAEKRNDNENPNTVLEKKKFTVPELLKFKDISPVSEDVFKKLNSIKNDVSIVKVKETENRKELASHSVEPIKDLDVRVKRLLQESWLDMNDDIDASHGQEIYEKLLSSLPGEDNDMNLKEKVSKKGNRKKITNSAEVKENTKSEIEDLPFENYYDSKTIEQGLADGTLIKDTLRINSKNTKEAYVHCLADNKDIFIDGVKDRNRALDGDEVIVEIYSEEKWKKSTEDSIQKCGKVVAISQHVHPRTIVGYLKLVYGKSYGIIIWPRDNRLPRVRVSEKTCPPNFRNAHRRYNNFLFLAEITSWQSVKSAEGHVLRMLGEDDSIDVESESILIDNNIDMKPFDDEELLAGFSDDIPSSEFERREDIRTKCVFTIDPPTAKDLDDAVSYCELPNGNSEVGVHIADVSHYIKHNSPIDEDIREKTTSVYLIEKVYHMLPYKLCQICSLLPGTDKLAFSVFVELDENAEIVRHRFSKTIIRSCAQFSYNHAQLIIDSNDEGVDYTLFPSVSNEFSSEHCAEIIWKLHKLAKKIRTRRLESGALRIDQPKILFELNEDRMPKSYSLYMGKECNWLIEEFMLMANILAAEQIYKSFPNTSLLRHHSAPKEKSLKCLSEFLEKVGVFIDVSSAGAIYKSMAHYDCGDEIGESRMAVIMNQLVKPMMRASYICSMSSLENSPDLNHYALNVPLYTHFTSPIRRYPDIIVHRLLAATIQYEECPPLNADMVQNIATKCNIKKNAAKKASEMSAEFFLKMYLQKNGPLRSRGVVVEVREKFLEVIDLSTRIVGRCYLDKVKNAEKCEFQKGGEHIVPTILITWKGQTNSEALHIFTVVDIELSYSKNIEKNLSNRPTVTLIGSCERNLASFS